MTAEGYSHNMGHVGQCVFANDAIRFKDSKCLLSPQRGKYTFAFKGSLKHNKRQKLFTWILNVDYHITLKYYHRIMG